MDYKEGKGLTMQLVKGEKKLRETHIKREVLEVVAKHLRHAARFTLATQRRNENPSILLAQDTEISKDTIEVEGRRKMMEGKISEFVKKEELVERAKYLIRVHNKSRGKYEKELEALDKKVTLTKEEVNRYTSLSRLLIDLRNELGAVIETIVMLDIMEDEEAAEYLASLEEGEKDDQKV